MSGVVKFSEAVSLAIHAMVLLAANPDGVLSAKEIASRFQVSSTHLAKVMQKLAKSGFVLSVRGARGGFKLARKSNDISLLDIFECIEGPFRVHDCLLDKKVCGGSACLLGDEVSRVNQEMKDLLASKNLSELTRSYLLRWNGSGTH